MKKNKKIFAFDLDGTLLNGKNKIDQTSKEAIKLIHKNGDIPVIATGRHIFTAYDIAIETGVDYFIGVNGALVIDLKTNKPVHQSFMKPEIIQMLVKYLDENKVGFALYTEEKIYTLGIENSNSDLRKFMTNLYNNKEYGVQLKSIKDLSRSEWNILFDKTYKIIAIPGVSQESGIFDELEVIFGQHTNINQGGNSTIEINNSGDNKWKGIQILNEYIKNSTEHPTTKICTFGDNYNDWYMLKNADIAVVMDNAEDPIKEIATFVTDDNNSDGILNGVKKIYEM